MIAEDVMRGKSISRDREGAMMRTVARGPDSTDRMRKLEPAGIESA